MLSLMGIVLIMVMFLFALNVASSKVVKKEDENSMETSVSDAQPVTATATEAAATTTTGKISIETYRFGSYGPGTRKEMASNS